MNELNIKLNVEQLNQLISILAETKTGSNVWPLMSNIRQQAETQIQEANKYGDNKEE